MDTEDSPNDSEIVVYGTHYCLSTQFVCFATFVMAIIAFLCALGFYHGCVRLGMPPVVPLVALACGIIELIYKFPTGQHEKKKTQ